MQALCFILLRLNPLGQRMLPIVISLSRMLCFGRVCASPCALNVSAALQGAYRWIRVNVCISLLEKEPLTGSTSGDSKRGPGWAIVPRFLLDPRLAFPVFN